MAGLERFVKLQCSNCGKGTTWMSGPKPKICPSCGSSFDMSKKTELLIGFAILLIIAVIIFSIFR